MYDFIIRLVDIARKYRRGLNDKQREQAAKGFHSVSIGAGITVGLNFLTDDKINTGIDNMIMFIAFLCAIMFQVLAILVLKDSGGDK